MNEILVFDRAARLDGFSPVGGRKAFASRLKRFIARAAREFFRGKRVTASFILVGDAETRRLNLKYLSRSGSTDVISFYYDASPDPESIDGDVFINTAQAIRQCPASSRGTSPAGKRSRPSVAEKEILLLAAHGFLHLAGYKDYTRREKARMWKLQDKIIRRLARQSV